LYHHLDFNKLKKLNYKYEAITSYITLIDKIDVIANIAKKENGEDFMDFLGYNPLKNSIDLYLNADFVSPDKMSEIESQLIKNDAVFEVSYDKSLITLLTQNVKRISLWVLIFSGLLSFIAMILINNSIRLSVYSKRFTIKTMQMVGATKRFIRRPFVWNSVKLGAIGSLLAVIILFIALYYMNNYFPEFEFFKNTEMLVILFGGIFLLGIVISWFSAFFATQRFLNLKTDQLYY